MEVILLLSLATAVWGGPLTKTYDCPSGWVRVLLHNKYVRIIE